VPVRENFRLKLLGAQRLRGLLAAAASARAEMSSEARHVSCWFGGQ
jgi:hypothetical protein